MLLLLLLTDGVDIDEVLRPWYTGRGHFRQRRRLAHNRSIIAPLFLRTGTKTKNHRERRGCGLSSLGRLEMRKKKKQNEGGEKKGG